MRQLGLFALAYLLATGNHFLADIAAGAAVTVVGYALGRGVALVRSGQGRLGAPQPAFATSG